ncbi:MAG: hypothetical protein ACRC1D_05980 [Culicoidibacterales bacterium]
MGTNPNQFDGGPSGYFNGLAEGYIYQGWEDADDEDMNDQYPALVPSS